MDLISIVILAFSTVFCVVYKDSGDKVFLAMMLTYILLMQDFILWSVKCWAFVE